MPLPRASWRVRNAVVSTPGIAIVLPRRDSRVTGLVAMTIGPWKHMDTLVKAARVADVEALAWLDQHLAGGMVARDQPVRVHVTGAGDTRWVGSLGFELRLHGEGALP